VKLNYQSNVLKVAGIVIQKLSNSIFRLKRKYFRLMFMLGAVGSLKKLNLGDGQRFDVPVLVGGGKGILSINDGVGFGWRTAPKMGDGTILLEPRSVDSEIEIGKRTMFSNNVSIISMEKVSIGKDCLIGDFTSIMDCNFHDTDPRKRMHSGEVKPVLIDDNVWIGSRVLILQGVTIGKNSVIGAGSIVTHNIPENTLAAGIPAKIIKAL